MDKPLLCPKVVATFLPFPGHAGTQTSRSVNGDGDDDGIEFDDGGDYEDDANCNISGRKDGELS